MIKIAGSSGVRYRYIGNVGTKAIFRTNKDAPNNKLVSTDLENFKENEWSDLIPEHSQNTLDWAGAVSGDKLITCYLEDVKVCFLLYTFQYRINNKKYKLFPDYFKSL